MRPEAWEMTAVCPYLPQSHQGGEGPGTNRVLPFDYCGQPQSANAETVVPGYPWFPDCYGRQTAHPTTSPRMAAVWAGTPGGHSMGGQTRNCIRGAPKQSDENVGSCLLVTDVHQACQLPGASAFRQRGSTCTGSSQDPRGAVFECGQLPALSARYSKALKQSSPCQKAQSDISPSRRGDSRNVVCSRDNHARHETFTPPDLEGFTEATNRSPSQQLRPAAPVRLTQHSAVEPVFIRVACSSTPVVLPLDVQRRYRRIDPKTKEEYLEIPYVSFCTGGSPWPVQTAESSKRSTMVFQGVPNKPPLVPGSAVSPPQDSSAFQNQETWARLHNMRRDSSFERSENSIFGKGCNNNVTRAGRVPRTGGSTLVERETGNQPGQPPARPHGSEPLCVTRPKGSRPSRHNFSFVSPSEKEPFCEAPERAPGTPPTEIDKASLAPCHSYSVGDSSSPLSRCITRSAPSESDEENNRSFFTSGAFETSGITKRLRCLSSLQAEQRVSRNPAKYRDTCRVSPYAVSSGRASLELMEGFGGALPRCENPRPVEKWQILGEGTQVRHPEGGWQMPFQLQEDVLPAAFEYAATEGLHECCTPVRLVSTGSTAAVSRSSQSDQGEKDLQFQRSIYGHSWTLSQGACSTELDETIMTILARTGANSAR